MQITRLIVLLNILFARVFTNAQSAADFGFIEHTFSDKKLGEVHFYISDTLHNTEKPLLVFLDGSGNNPLFYYKKSADGKKNMYSSVPLNLSALKIKYHVLLISKPNTAFVKEQQPEIFVDSVYDYYASCDWRVESASKAIEFALKNYPINKKKIVVFGYSEGGQVAPRLAVFNKNITHCIAFVGGALNQFFDEIIKYRNLAFNNEMSQEEAQTIIDSLYLEYQKIYAEADRTDKYWYGHTYKRWSSYTKIPTIDYLKQLTIPVYIAQGTDDQNTSVLSSDYLKLEFIRLHKTNLTYKTYPNCNHYFTNVKTHQNILDKVIEEAMEWLNNN